MFATTVYTGNGSVTGRPLQISKRWKNVGATLGSPENRRRMFRLCGEILP